MGVPTGLAARQPHRFGPTSARDAISGILISRTILPPRATGFEGRIDRRSPAFPNRAPSAAMRWFCMVRCRTISVRRPRIGDRSRIDHRATESVVEPVSVPSNGWIGEVRWFGRRPTSSALDRPLLARIGRTMITVSDGRVHVRRSAGLASVERPRSHPRATVPSDRLPQLTLLESAAPVL